MALANRTAPAAAAEVQNPFITDGAGVPPLKGPDLVAQAQAAVAAAGDAPWSDPEVVEVEAEVSTAPATPEPAPAATTTAVMARASSAVVVAAADDLELAQLSKLENKMPSLAGVAPGTFPRITAGLDGFAVNKGEMSYGKWIVVDIISWNSLTVCTHGLSTATAEQNRLMRISTDHKYLKDSDKLVVDYIKELRDVHGFTKACSKGYIEVFGAVVDSAERGKVAENDQALAQISLSPQSVAAWTGFLATLMWQKSKGRSADRVRIKMMVNAKVLGANRFAVVSYSLAD